MAKDTKKASAKPVRASKPVVKKTGKEIGKGAEPSGTGMKKAATKTVDATRLRLHLGSKPRTAATAGTTGYARAFHRAFDLQPRGRSGSAVWRLVARRCARGTRCRQWSARRPFRPTIQHGHGYRQTEGYLHVVVPARTSCTQRESAFPDFAVVIELKGERYNELIVEVADPQGAVELVKRRIATLNRAWQSSIVLQASACSKR